MREGNFLVQDEWEVGVARVEQEQSSESRSGYEKGRRGSKWCFFFFVSDWKKIKSISTENMKVIFSLQIFNVIVSIEVSFF